MSHDDYTVRLAADRLERVYAIAPPRVRLHLEAEAKYAASRLRPGDVVLDLGCGYGRVIPELSRRAAKIIGADSALDSLKLARRRLTGIPNQAVAAMKAPDLGFRGGVFDAVVCIQNGISAFHIDPRSLLQESLRVTKPGGYALFSTYTAAFWPYRLEWFRKHVETGLLGEIDEERTRDGEIVCKDGFTATTFDRNRFRAAAAGLPASLEFVEIDGSCLFAELRRLPAAAAGVRRPPSTVRRLATGIRRTARERRAGAGIRRYR